LNLSALWRNHWQSTRRHKQVHSLAGRNIDSSNGIANSALTTRL
jgi:hypothetical protein